MSPVVYLNGSGTCLVGRTQLLFMGQLSSIGRLDFGVPQGSVLGPSPFPAVYCRAAGFGAEHGLYHPSHLVAVHGSVIIHRSTGFRRSAGFGAEHGLYHQSGDGPDIVNAIETIVDHGLVGNF